MSKPIRTPPFLFDEDGEVFEEKMQNACKMHYYAGKELLK